MKTSWQTKKLEELCFIKPPKKEAKAVLNEKDNVSFVPMEDLGVLTKKIIPKQERRLKEVSGSYTYFANEDVLLAKITPCFENGKIGIARDLKNGIGFGSSEYLVFRSKGQIVPDYLFYALSSDQFREEGQKTMSGAVGHKRVSKEFIDNYPLPYPESLSEQKRIVSILDESFEAIEKAKENAEKNLKNAKEIFESYLGSVFANSDNKFEYGKLVDLTDEITDGDHQPPPKSQTGIPFITISNINKETNKIDFSDTFKVSKEYFKNLKNHRRPKLGDVLYTVTGSFGIPVVIESDIDFCFQRHIGLIRPNKLTNSKWLYYLILSPQLIKQANDSATGTAQKTVSLKALRNFIVPKVPLSEQSSIVAKLDTLSEQTKALEMVYKQKLEALEELKQSLLKKAFNGEL